MAYYQQSLKTFIDTKLNVNTKNVLFDVKLYNDIDSNDFNVESVVENTYTTEFKRQVPTMITNIQGEYIPIPNLNATNNSVEIIFDLAVDDMTGQENESEFETVDYNNSLLAIDEFKKELLAKYHTLGTTNLMMGGSDSSFDINQSVSIEKLVMYFDITPMSTDTEAILGVYEGIGSVYKNSTHIIYLADTGQSMQIPYAVDTNIKFVIYHDGGTIWRMKDNTNSVATSSIVSTTTGSSITFGDTIGFTGLVNRVAINNIEVTSFDLDDLTNELENFIIDINIWDNKDLLTNSGSVTFLSSPINNSLLWGSDGNVVFQVYPLAVIGEYTSENGVNYHSFSLQLEAMIGDNFIFGNNFEYYIKETSEESFTQVFPVDRSHTFALDTQGRQGINDNVMTFIGSESALDWTQSFFYQPTPKLTSLVKKITTGDVEQNKTYTIKVQYPFWNKEYNVVIEGGGINTDINSITTFSLQFKLADDILVP
jgi:hypothetical protein